MDPSDGRRAAGTDERLPGEPEMDHGKLASLLVEGDLAFATDPRRAPDADFAFDPAADPHRVFPQSVASGGPTPTGVILWTRVAPEVFEPGRRLGVEVAGDPDFSARVFRGIVDDDETIAAHDHTVKVDLDGVLEPGTRYWYRFVYDGTASQTGRCRTLPAPDASPESVSFAVLTCQNYLNGYNGALSHVGDFVYESATGEFKGFGSGDYDRQIEFPSGEDRVDGLADYRYLYRTYRSDPLLEDLTASHTLSRRGGPGRVTGTARERFGSAIRRSLQPIWG